MSTPAFALRHTTISEIGVLSGLIVLGGMYSAQRLPGWTALFLLTTAVTSIMLGILALMKFHPERKLA